MKRIMITGAGIGALILFSGCAVFNIGKTGLEKTRISAELIVATYKGLYEEIRDYTPNESQKKAYNQIVDKMNEIKPVIAEYLSIIEVWEATGQKPQDIEKIKRKVEDALQGIIEMMIRIKKEK